MPFWVGSSTRDFDHFPPEDSLGLFVCDRGYVQAEKTEILFVAICLRLTHFFLIKCLYYRGTRDGSVWKEESREGLKWE